jgi:hypothetical protein
MTCEEYLRLLSTSHIEEMSAPRAREHAATCAECHRVTTVVVERERNMMMTLNGVASLVQPHDTARAALLGARRRRVGRMYMLALVVLLGASATMVLRRSILPRSGILRGPALITETFRPTCISATEAGELIAPYVRSDGSAYYTREASNALTVRATEEELMKSRSMLDRYDNPSASTCTVRPR